ncbi:MAG: hypothetical protein DCE92_01840 [Alphaproteobacteria bacterium]|nr:MAG: hypothetical protein DCE92_01840 [Alphaproteobacteria bacterium]
MTPKLLATYDDARALEEMGLQALREKWCELFGPPHPPLRSADLLCRLIAWRIQAAAEGGLDRQTLRLIKTAKASKGPGPTLTPGVRITREWRGRVCDVDVVGEGFLFEGRPYNSLSEVARDITGVRWNGPRFFGLRKADGA